MSKGPKNAYLQEQLEAETQKRLEAMRLPPMPKIRDWRMPPEGREYARRSHVWELLAWYHHEVYLKEYAGLRNWLRRKWRALFGGWRGRVLNKSPWEQLALRDRAEAEELAARELLLERQENEARG